MMEDARKYTTDSGMKIELQPISLYEIDMIRDGTIEKWREKGEAIDPPQYVSLAVGGAEIKHDLTEDNLDVDGDEAETQRRHEAWAKHKDATDRMNEEIGRLVTDLYFDGIANVTEVPQEWIEKKKRRNIRIPTDKDELLTLYKRIEIAKTINDVREIRSRVIALSLPNIPKQAAVGAAEKSFPDTVQEKPE